MSIEIEEMKHTDTIFGIFLQATPLSGVTKRETLLSAFEGLLSLADLTGGRSLLPQLIQEQLKEAAPLLVQGLEEAITKTRASNVVSDSPGTLPPETTSTNALFFPFCRRSTMIPFPWWRQFLGLLGPCLKSQGTLTRLRKCWSRRGCSRACSCSH